MIPRGGPSVMARRREPPDSLDYFPTPPWATRAFCDVLMRHHGALPHDTLWDPACGEGHLCVAAGDMGFSTKGSDIFDYGFGGVSDFLHDPRWLGFRPDWIITNPPFRLAGAFYEKMAAAANKGAAILVRLAWLESAERFNLFERLPPTAVYVCSERVPMHKGRWEPNGSTATAYCWIVNETCVADGSFTRLDFIKPGSKKRFTRPDDAKRFGAKVAAPLIEAAPTDTRI